MTQSEIKTQRLILRPFKSDDAKAVQFLAGNKKVSEPTRNIPYPYEDGMAEEWISTLARKWGNGSEATYAVTDRKSKQLFGAVSLLKIQDSSARLGYWIGESFWGNGYGTEAAKELVGFACSNLGIVKIAAEHLSSNPASGRVMEKIGMCHIGSEHKPDRNGQMAQIKIYELENKERASMAKYNGRS